jgi:hypothetical protein
MRRRRVIRNLVAGAAAAGLSISPMRQPRDHRSSAKSPGAYSARRESGLRSSVRPVDVFLSSAMRTRSR